MEPMALGSPPSSPSTSPITNPNFLPAFLMGEQQNSPRPNISPTKNRSSVFKPNTPVTETRTRFFPQSPHDQSTFSEKNGPPSRGLFDTIDGQLTTNLREVEQRNLNDSLNKSYRRVEPTESMWVTVLGFPPHAASLVLSLFAQCGNIIEKKFPAEGNWLHLKFSSSYEAAKALSFNGKFLSNSIMIGVVPCGLSDNKENLNESYNLNLMSPNRARPLTQNFLAKQTSTEVLSPQNVPQKSTGLVSKAMEYVFGW